MFESVALYATPELGEKVCQYASEHSTSIPKYIADYHASCSNHERAIMLSSNFQSQLNIFLAKMIGAKRVLEIGVYLGYSAMVWSHAVGPDGFVTGIESVNEWAKAANEAFQASGIKNITLQVGPAEEILPILHPTEPYDLVFVDAEKTGYSTYLKLLLDGSKPDNYNRILRPGALIIADNVLRQGHVVDESIPYNPQLGL